MSVIWNRLFLLSAAVFFFCTTLIGAAPETVVEEEPVVADVLIVVGADGTPEYGEQFRAWAKQLRQTAEASNASVLVIGDSDAVDSEPGKANSNVDDFDRLNELITVRFSKQTNVPLWIILIGHGTYAGDVAKFNLRGPDVSAAQLNESLAQLRRPIVIVNNTSSSGPFIDRLSGPTRIIVTATKSGNEQNFARFGRFFAESLGEKDADLDHDDSISILEAFIRASKLVELEYVGADRLATEHAVIDDNGDQRGTPATMFRGTHVDGKASDNAAPDGYKAARATLFRWGDQWTWSAEHEDRRRELEKQHEELRKNRKNLTDQAYDDQLEPIMLALAKLYQEVESSQSSETEDQIVDPTN